MAHFWQAGGGQHKKADLWMSKLGMNTELTASGVLEPSHQASRTGADYSMQVGPWLEIIHQAPMDMAAGATGELLVQARERPACRPFSGNSAQASQKQGAPLGFRVLGWQVAAAYTGSSISSTCRLVWDTQRLVMGQCQSQRRQVKDRKQKAARKGEDEKVIQIVKKS